MNEVRVVNYTISLPFTLNLTPTEKKIVVKFQNDSLYQNILSFNARPIPIASLDSELGSLREIQASRETASKWSYIASYTSIFVTMLIILTFVAICYCRYLLRENRDRHGRAPGGPGMFVRLHDYFRPPQDPHALYRQQPIPLAELEPYPDVVS